jgi:hypothetical protein
MPSQAPEAYSMTNQKTDCNLREGARHESGPGTVYLETGRNLSVWRTHARRPFLYYYAFLPHIRPAAPTSMSHTSCAGIRGSECVYIWWAQRRLLGGAKKPPAARIGSPTCLNAKRRGSLRELREGRFANRPQVC